MGLPGLRPAGRRPRRSARRRSRPSSCRKLVQDAEAQVGPVDRRASSPSRRTSTTPAARRRWTPAGSPAWTCSTSSTSRRAAALAYIVQSATAAGPDEAAADAPRTVLVYDLGGGTFDVTLVRLGEEAVPGAGHRGGRAARRQGLGRPAGAATRPGSSSEQYGTDPRADPQSLAMLQASAERAKRTLSKVEQASITVAHAGHKMTVPGHPGRVRGADPGPARPHPADDPAGARRRPG